MSLLRKMFGKKADETRYVICPGCGAGYNTSMVAMSIFATSPYIADTPSWNTRITCKNCRREIWVSGSHHTVFGEPRPKQGEAGGIRN